MEIKTFHGFEDFCVEKFEVSYAFLIKLAGHMSR